MGLWKWMMGAAVIVASSAMAAEPPAAPAKGPKPQFQGDFFGEMARAMATITEVDAKGRALIVKLDKDGKLVRVPIRDDTELRFRDSWGELENYFAGQHVMLFVYVDEDRNWTYPRAVQDDIQVAALHNWYAAVTAIDADKRTYSTRREEKDKAGKVTKTEDKQYAFDLMVKVWKGAEAGGIDSLKVGDEVIQQLVEKDGKLVAVEILDRKGDEAVRAVQNAQHRKDQDRLGLPAYVNDIETIAGALTVTVAWSGADRARDIKVADVIALVPADGGKALAGAVVATERVDSRQRLQLAINARTAARLAVGQSVRVFVPGTGPEAPTGKSGVPAAAYK